MLCPGTLIDRVGLYMQGWRVKLWPKGAGRSVQVKSLLCGHFTCESLLHSHVALPCFFFFFGPRFKSPLSSPCVQLWRLLLPPLPQTSGGGVSGWGPPSTLTTAGREWREICQALEEWHRWFVVIFKSAVVHLLTWTFFLFTQLYIFSLISTQYSCISHWVPSF